MKKQNFALLALSLLLSPAAQAAWSCECLTEEATFVVDGATEQEARKTCTSQEEDGYGGEVISCQSQGRGDR